jgi:hypothetical protein
VFFDLTAFADRFAGTMAALERVDPNLELARCHLVVSAVVPTDIVFAGARMGAMCPLRVE